MQMNKIILKIVPENEIRKIHDTALKVLQNVGIKVSGEQGQKLLGGIGADVDTTTGRVKISRRIIEEYLDVTPGKFVLGARNPRYDVPLNINNRRVFTRPTGGPDLIVDSKTNKIRKTSTQDLKEWTILLDRLPNMSYTMGIYPNDIPLQTRDIEILQLMFQNTEKHIGIQPYTKRNIEYMYELALSILGDEAEFRRRPLFSVLISCNTPLVYADNNIDMFTTAARLGIPVMLNSTPMAGATGPVTVAGMLTLLHAEQMASNLIVQASQPGTPVLYEARPNILDMSTMVCGRGYVEHGMAGGIATQLAHHCGMIAEVYGPSSDSKPSDGQAAIEKTFNVITTALSGADVVSGAGILDSNASVSLVQLVIDHDILCRMMKMMRGIEVNDETLAYSVIEDVGPGGHFLEHDHTLKYFTNEYYRSDICNRQSRENWEKNPIRSLIDAAQQKINQILNKHLPAPLPPETANEFEKIVNRAKEEIC